MIGWRTSDLVNEDELLQLRGQCDETLWAIGIIANRTRDSFFGDGPMARHAATLKAIADLAGMPTRYVAELSSVAWFYRPLSHELFPEATRSPFSRELFPELTHWHFRQAMHAGSLSSAGQWLKLAVTSADGFGGKPMPVDVLAAQMAAQRASDQGRTHVMPARSRNQLLGLLRQVQDTVEDQETQVLAAELSLRIRYAHSSTNTPQDVNERRDQEVPAQA